jgi:hypothetical protein
MDKGWRLPDPSWKVRPVGPEPANVIDGVAGIGPR